MRRQTAQTNPYEPKKIAQDEFKLAESNGENSFKYELNLTKGKYNGDHEIKIFFEKGNYKESVVLGTVTTHNTHGVKTVDIPTGVVPTVELTIVDTDTRIFSAKSTKINFLVDEKADSLLPVKGVDLGERLWEVEIDAHAGPLLKFNSRPDLNFKSRLLEDWAVRGSVATAALRLILARLGKSQGEEEWMEKWLTWLKKMDLADPESNGEIRDDEIDEIIERFADTHGKFAAKLANQNAQGKN